MVKYLLLITFLWNASFAFAQYAGDKYFESDILTSTVSEFFITKPAIADDGYDRIERFKKGYYWVYNKNMQGLVDKDGVVIIEPEYDNIKPYQKRYAWIYKDDKQGLVSLYDGVVIYEAEWDHIHEFRNGKAMGMKNDKVYILGLDGVVIVQ